MSMQLTIFEHSKTEKRCSKCKEVKSLDNFCKSKRTKDSLNYYCNQCLNFYYQNNYKKNKEVYALRSKVYNENNKESIARRSKAYRENNKEVKTQYRKVYYSQNKERIKERNKTYRQNNQEVISQGRKTYYENNKVVVVQRSIVYADQRRKSDPLFRLIGNLRRRNSLFCKSVGLQKNYSTTKAIGCTREEFIAYLKSKFTEGMTWENYGAWHVDHIKPISLATTEQEAIELSHYTNLQPLWAADNLSKGNKYE